MIDLARRSWLKFYNKLIFFAPVLTVIAIATILVYCSYQANFVITAAVVAEEGSGSEAASAGLINALTFILPAIVGGFIIALLFKYRKKLTLKFFFGGALFFAGTFITFFFGDSILYLVQTQIYKLFILDFDPYNIEIFNLKPLIWFDEIYLIMIICCGILSSWIAFVITSPKFNKNTKNYALLLISGLMGAFLSVILPTYTVVILLIALSIYDIYSVRRGPIKDIIKYTMEDEERFYNNMEKNNNLIHSENHGVGINKYLCSITSKIDRNKNNISNVNTYDISYANAQMNTQMNTKINAQMKTQTNAQNKLDDRIEALPPDDSDFMLNSMTYSSNDWDIGIGDLVFYSMLASQPLTPYFISNHGGALMANFGFWIFWIIALFTIIGILIGFVITIYLLERNSMLPGLPCSIALGLTGFLGSTLIFSLI